jgi:hypothetical protein
MGDDGAGVLLEMVPSATPPHARNAPSSRPKGDGDKRKALPEEHDPFEVRRPWWEQYREQFGEPRLK